MTHGAADLELADGLAVLGQHVAGLADDAGLDARRAAGPGCRGSATPSSPSTPAGGRATEPSGEVSVMPQAWMMWMPCRSLERLHAAPAGTAEPPT